MYICANTARCCPQKEVAALVAPNTNNELHTTSMNISHLVSPQLIFSSHSLATDDIEFTQYLDNLSVYFRDAS